MPPINWASLMIEVAKRFGPDVARHAVEFMRARSAAGAASQASAGVESDLVAALEMLAARTEGVARDVNSLHGDVGTIRGDLRSLDSRLAHAEEMHRERMDKAMQTIDDAAGRVSAVADAQRSTSTLAWVAVGLSAVNLVLIIIILVKISAR